MKVINLTPHAIVFRPSFGDAHLGHRDVTFPPSGAVARVSGTPGTVITRDDLFFGCVVAGPSTYGPVEGLSDPEDGVIYLVSLMVLERCDGRADVFAPGTGPNDGAVRNDKGQVAAVTRLISAGH